MSQPKDLKSPAADGATELSMAGRTVAILAANGDIAGAVAREMARRGAVLYLSARSGAELEERARHLRSLVPVHTDVVDVADAEAVQEYFHSLHRRGAIIDFLLNPVGPRAGEARYGTRSVDLRIEQFLLPLDLIVGSQFLTATRSRSVMRPGPASVVVMLTASLARSGVPLMAGVTAACDAVQGLSRVLAAEFADSGPRVICARVDAIPASRTIQETMAANAATMGLTVEEFARTLPGGPGAPLGLEQVGREIADLANPSTRWPSGSLIDIVGR